MEKRKFIILCLFAAIFSSADLAFALDPRKAITQYRHDVWKDELPQNSVQSIIQTRDGYLWFGTHEGLARFDGVSFTVFDHRNIPEIKSSSILILFEDHAGNLWAGTNNGLNCYKDGKFIYYGSDAVLANKIIYAIYEDLDGRLWIGTNRGLTSFKDGKFVNYTINDGVSEKLIRSIIQDKKGNVWIGTSEGLICRRNGKFTSYTTRDGLSQNLVRTIIEDQKGNIWIGTEGGLNRFRDGKFTNYTSKDGLAHDLVRTIIEDRKGNIWIGTGAGLSRFRDGEFADYAGKDGLVQGLVSTIFEDREGNIWIGADAGLSRFSDGKFTVYTSKEGLTQDFVRMIYEDREGSLWVGTNGGLNKFSDGKFLNFTVLEGLSNNFVRVIFEDKAGDIWVGVDVGGLNRLRDGKITSYTVKDGLLNNVVLSLYEDRESNLWIGTRGGLSSLKNGRFTNYTTSDGLANNSVRAIRQDRRGDLWIGTEGGGLNRFRDGRFTTYTTAEGLASNDIRAIFEDRNGALWIGSYAGINCLKDGKFTACSAEEGISFGIIFDFHEDQEGNLWIGSDNGLILFRNDKFIRYSSQSGLYDDRVFRILEDKSGNLWMSSNRGISRTSIKELLDFAAGAIKRVSYISYGKSDGMPANQCNGSTTPAGWKSRDGRLWFPTVSGATVIDPAHIRLNDFVPPVAIEKVAVDGRVIDPGEESSLTPDKKKFEFHYAGLSFLSPSKVYFKYKLEGYDKEWVEAGTRRAAYYTNIPPGDYQFKVVACNNDGLWNESGASYSFHLMTPFHQTRAAYLVYIGLISVICYAIVQLRIRSLRRRNKQLEAKVEGRTAELAEKMEQLKFSQRLALEANQAKSIFLANMSHELRTPLNAILGFAQIIARKQNYGPEEQEHLSNIIRSGKHLLALINDVLSISKIEAGKVTLNNNDFNFHHLLRDLKSTFQSRTLAKGIDLIVELDPALPEYVRSDEGKIRQALINLLGNAVKFTDEGWVALRVRWRDGRAVFEVEDSGYGISTRDIERLFEPFSQTESGEQSKEGTGLGLSISRNFARLMNGDITVESERGKGSLFRFEVDLPVAALSQRLSQEGRVIGIKEGQPDYRILAVDDRKENRDALNGLLKSVGFKVREASNGLEALEIWREWKPDLIWMDMRMKVMDGYTATEQIRTESRTHTNGNIHSQTVIIALTASAFEQDHERILAAGCNDIVTKPYLDSIIFEKMEKHLGVRFLYEKDHSKLSYALQPEAANQDLSVRLKKAPVELLKQLHKSILQGSPDAPIATINEIRKHDELLAEKLFQMVKAYQLDELINLLEKL